MERMRLWGWSDGKRGGEAGEKVIGEMARAAALFFVPTQNC